MGVNVAHQTLDLFEMGRIKMVFDAFDDTVHLLGRSHLQECQQTLQELMAGIQESPAPTTLGCKAQAAISLVSQ
jgi:hypothetical protein